MFNHVRAARPARGKGRGRISLMGVTIYLIIVGAFFVFLMMYTYGLDRGRDDHLESGA